MAVLYRTQKTGRQFQVEMRRQEIPFNVHGVSFWRRKVVKNVVAVLRLVKNRTDDQAFRRLLKAFMYQPENKECAKSILAHVEKVARARKTSMWEEGKACLQVCRLSSFDIGCHTLISPIACHILISLVLSYTM